MTTTTADWEATVQLRFSTARVLQQLWTRRTVETHHRPGSAWGQRIEGRETEWRDVPSEAAHIHTLTDQPEHYSGEFTLSKVPFLSRAAALNLKETAEDVLRHPADRNVPEPERDMVVRCVDVLSLIEQSYSANLGLATTGELLEEIKTRVEVGLPGGLEYRTVGDEERYLQLRGTR